MKVLYISTEEIGAPHGGAVHTWETARHLARRGNAVTLVVPAADNLPDEETREGVRILRAPMRAFGRSFPLRLALRAGRLARLGCDVVLSRASALGGGDLLAARLAGAPLALEINNPHAEELILRHGLGPAAAAAVRAWSEWIASQAAGAVAPNARIAPAGVPVLETPWGVDTDAFHPRLREDGTRAALRRELGLADRPTALFTGTFRPWHGAHLVPAIARALRRTVPEALFLLAGDGPTRPRVEEAVARAGLADAVRLLGAQPYARIPALCAAADVGIAPFAPAENPLFARFGFYYAPLKIFEYMAAGLPTVTADLAPLDRYVEAGRTGLLAPAGDAEGFAAALARVLADGAARARMGRLARETAAVRYGWAAHAAAVERFLNGIIRGRRTDAANPA